jgi:hypothetical protein
VIQRARHAVDQFSAGALVRDGADVSCFPSVLQSQEISQVLRAELLALGDATVLGASGECET